MTELAAGAVSSLLVVIRNEALLLRGVQDDVQFIQEEMESMNSFLAHLAQSVPPGGEHDEQGRTWMNQVRLLAQDCNNCIDLYLYRGNPDIHRAKGMFRRYLWWVYWSLHKLLAQHRAAVRLRQLKDRARDVGERRLRYGVVVPAKSVRLGDLPSPAAGQMPSSSATSASAVAGGYGYADAYAAEDDEEEGEDQLVVATATTHSGQRAFCEPTLDNHVKAKLLEWFREIPPGADETFSVALMALTPDTYQEALALARDTLSTADDKVGYSRNILVNIPAVHLQSLPLRPKEVLYYILRELRKAPSQKQKQGKWDEAELDSWQDYHRKLFIYYDKKDELDAIKEDIKRMKIYEKLDKIKEDAKAMKIHEKLDKIKNNDIQVQKEKSECKGGQQQPLQLDRGQKTLVNMDIDQLDLDVLLLMLHQSTIADVRQQDQLKNKAEMYNLPSWDDIIILKIAKKLKDHMEVDIKDREPNNEQMKVGEKEEIDKQEEQEREEREEGNHHQQLEELNKEMKKGDKEEEEEEKEMDKETRKEEDKEEKQQEEKLNMEMEIEDMNKKVEQNDDDEKDDDDDDDEEDDDDDEDNNNSTHLYKDQYAQILREVFPKTSSNNPLQDQQQDNSEAKQATNIMTTTLDNEQIKQMIREAKEEVLRELEEGKPDKNQASGEPAGVESQKQKVHFVEEFVQKIEKIKKQLKEKIKINSIVDKIKHHLKWDCPLIILKVDEMMDGTRWEEIRQALNLLKCSADAVILTTTKSTEKAKGYYYKTREPIDYSLVGLHHDKVLKFITSRQKNEDSPNPKVLHGILEECQPHEFCMKIFSHGLYANPKRSNEELKGLHNTLQDSPKSFNILAKKMFMYSYNDLPKEYKSCLLYLAIFPKEKKIRRSTLIGRWVAEGLTLKEDWPSSVLHANRCFDALIHRWFVYPADIDTIGKIKSCVVSDLVHAFITSIARKQHIMETRLSHHLARHFSIFNDLQLRSSDTINNFFRGLSKSSRVSLLKVLDLEGCQCFGGKNQRHLKDICSKMLLLKYLSLRGTDITYLPNEINNLRELEILDIRQTKVPEDATTNILLLKPKRLLAGNIDPTPGNFGTSVRVPRRINKMENMEILSNVKAKHRDDLKDIGNLWQLRKLGVVIEDKGGHLGYLLRTISDLHECLRSLSITLPSTVESQEDIGSRLQECLRSLSTALPVATPHEGTPSTVELPGNISSLLRHHPKILESLSISGTTLHGHLLPLFIKGDNNQLAKVTLSNTPLKQDDLEVLAKLPRLKYVRLKHNACTEPMLTFKDGDFRCLRYLLVEDSNLTNVTFEGGAAQLEKIVLSFTRKVSIAGADKLPKLQELEVNSRLCGELLSSFHEAKEIAKVTLRGALLEEDALKILANKPSMRCLVLSDMYSDGTQNQITFNNDEFIWLNLLVVDCSIINEIVFATGSAPRLEKIIWSSPTSLSGIDKLPRLKELEFNGDLVPKEVEEVIKNNKDKLKIKHNKPETQDQTKRDE